MSEGSAAGSLLGICCHRLSEELNREYDYKYFFERDGLLAITAGYNDATEGQQGHWVRVFANHCPFCGANIRPEINQRPN
jgi:prepilin signal peptidase PulO-like enzyme (type II secretory pathway)